MKNGKKRNDGKIFAKRYATRSEAEKELHFKLGNGSGYGIAWIIEII